MLETLKRRCVPAIRFPDRGCQTDSLAVCGPESLPKLAESMLRAGYGEGDCRAVLGENRLRLARDVWKPSSHPLSR